MAPLPQKVVLMVGFHFPPCALSSGHLRLLAFAKYLPEFGWDPAVLSAGQRAYEHVDDSSVATIPRGTLVHRAFALDARRHLGFRGRYPSILAQPDRWASWWPSAVVTGLRMIRRYRVRAIWSTFPIMTAHCVAHSLSRITGLPWIADFRDPVAISVAGKNRATRETQLRWERRIVARAACSVFTTSGAMRACSERFPTAFREGRLAVIPNGFDEDDFAGLPDPHARGEHDPLHLVHAGVLYREGRNPLPLFEAVARLRANGILDGGDLRITLRASGAEDMYAAELKRLGISDIIQLAPFLSYRDALAEQADADGLLLFQGPQFDHQIPAKLYEYVRLGRPVFAMVGAHGDTAELLRVMDNVTSTIIDDTSSIQEHLMQFIGSLRAARHTAIHAADVSQYSRRHTASALALLLNNVSGKSAVDIDTGNARTLERPTLNSDDRC